ncbi:hypothetical protein WBG78_27585 [Chryseolinea sp. T2]|uniref:hypothetical protein n=1 Tax=Chryseolinea sp. T2 TaxID=3129255 RepID=UPI0030770701
MRSLPILCVIVFISLGMFCCSKQKETKTILLLTSSKHFGSFAGEILKTEGFNHYSKDSIGSPALTSDTLNTFDIVVMTMTDVTDHQVKLLTNYVEGGGSLIAFRPDKKLYALFGIKDSQDTTHFHYVKINDDNGLGRGLIHEKLIFHGEFDSYDVDGGSSIATFLDKDGTGSRPAVVSNHLGKGRTLAFAYNLPESIVYMRQGNPKSAGLERDGILGIRAMDLFTHGFVDTTQNLLNPADEQMRLLSHGLEQMSGKPLPRIWYFPDSLKCVVTLNNDGEDSKEEEFLKQFNDVAQHGGSMTLYVKEPQFISPSRISSWMKDGFEISGHPDDTRQAVKPDWKTMDSVYTVLKSRLQKMYGIPTMKTITNHWFVWVGNDAHGTPNFAAQAKLESQHGVQLDCNYAHYDNGSDQGHFLGKMGVEQGNYTGTGLTMKFANGDGKVLDIYQQLNNVYDQQYMEHKDQDGYFGAFRGLMDRSLNNEVYSCISVRAHNNEYFFSEIPLMKMIDYAKSKGVPVWTELKWLEFLQTKDATTFDDIHWAEPELTFTVHSPLAFGRELSCLIPSAYNDLKATSVLRDGHSVPLDIVSIKGFEYVRILLKPASTHRVEVKFSE